MDKNTKQLNERWEALRETIKELAIEPKLNYNTNKGDTKMTTQKPVTKRLIEQLTAEIAKLKAMQDEALDNYTPDIESLVDHSDYIYYSYEDKITWVQSFIDELKGDK